MADQAEEVAAPARDSYHRLLLSVKKKDVLMRIRLLRIILGLVALVVSSAVDADDRPNVVLIMADDINECA